MTKQNHFKVSQDLKSYVRNVLSREGIPHRFRNEEGQLFCITCISGERFHKIVKRADCERRSDETGLLHLTYDESQDPLKSAALMSLFKKTSFVIAGSNKQ